MPAISVTRLFILCAEKGLDASFIASLTVTDNVTILHSLTHLYRIEKITKPFKSCFNTRIVGSISARLTGPGCFYRKTVSQRRVNFRSFLAFLQKSLPERR